MLQKKYYVNIKKKEKKKKTEYLAEFLNNNYMKNDMWLFNF